ncbi:Iron siderophore sensor protein [Hyphomicrobium sulfonivorans]|uniref:Iron siderophore sensor protein n=1 Tax=Hyphomicrobium sulfonivorans TaxID=121290 RepID=A0A120CW99_HYPSL|nr:FecR family protein [Hyphomicrobium sulfonivorans]KWT69059.1 Iron siderophore sensor protein [Hyphomicrobium sulfonivorans]
MTKRKPSWFDPELEAGLDPLQREAILWFNRLRADRVTAADRNAFNAWLDRDAAHGKAFQQIEDLWSGLAGLPEAQRRRRKAVTRRTVGKGVVALLIGGGIWGLYRSHPFADYRTGVGERLAVTLPDGSIAELSSDTALSIDDYAQTRRIILHRGEAFFKVAAVPGRPFVVEAEGGTVTALGTAFSVADGADGVLVTVTEHAVRIATSAGRDMRVDAGSQTIFTAGGAISPPHAIDPAVELAWREGRLVFVNARLDRVVEALNRWRRGRVVVMNSALAAHPVTLIVNLSDVDGALNQLQDALPLSVTSVTPLLTLLHAR